MSGVLGTAAWSTDPGYWRYAPIGSAGSPDAGEFSAARRIPYPGQSAYSPAAPARDLDCADPLRAKASRSSFPTSSPTGDPFSSSIPRAKTPGSRPPSGASVRPENGHPRSLGRGQSPLWIVAAGAPGSRRGRAIQSALDPRSRIRRVCRRSRLSRGFDHHQPEQPRSALGR